VNHFKAAVETLANGLTEIAHLSVCKMPYFCHSAREKLFNAIS